MTCTRGHKGSPKVGPMRGRLKRVFGIDIEVCDYCAGSVKVIACIEDKTVIEQILGHLKRKGDLPELVSLLPDSTGPPYKTIIV